MADKNNKFYLCYQIFENKTLKFEFLVPHHPAWACSDKTVPDISIG